MAFTPDSPFPKSRGHVIKSKDWNDAITEVQRLDTAKVNKSGDGITGSLTIEGNAGVGTTSPQAKLHVAGGGVRWGNNSELVIDQGGGIELGGNSTTAGTGTPYIDFHFSGLAQDFNTRIINDANGRLSLVAPTLQASGNVGIGTPTPADRLDVAGNLRILTGSNPIRFTSGWSGFPDPVNNQAEISNDTGNFKTLMIVGNKSGGLGRRVSVWDRLEVNGTFIGNGNVGIGLADPGFRLDVADRIRLRQGGSGTAGLWLFQSTPNRDQAFIGMRTDTSVGLWGNGVGWGLFMDTGSGAVTIADGLTVTGQAQLGANGAQVFIGGNRDGPFMRLNDDLWFSDPQNGTIQIRNHNNTTWGTLVGIFNNMSSVKYKKDTSVLGGTDLTHLLDDTLGTDVVRYRYKGDDEASRLRLGVITENCPEYLVGDDGESLSTAEYIAMLHGALKALASKVAVLEK